MARPESGEEAVEKASSVTVSAPAGEEGGGIVEDVSELTVRRSEAIGSLAHSPKGAAYRRRLREVAEELELSERSVRRLVQQWRAEGLAGLERLERADRGVSRLSGEWQAFIMQTWRWGNREGRRMSRAQVVVRVQARAIEIGEVCPSHTAVYRLLRGEFEKRQRQAPRIGWRGTRLELACKSGERLSVEQSNQVWQVDHTLVDVLLVDEAGGVV